MKIYEAVFTTLSDASPRMRQAMKKRYNIQKNLQYRNATDFKPHFAKVNSETLRLALRSHIKSLEGAMEFDPDNE